MKIIFIVAIIFALSSDVLFSQTNCSNPVQLNICPDTILLNQTNAGMLDDAPPGINLIGEDVVYQINVPVTTVRIHVAISNPAGVIYSRLVKNTCNNITGSSTYTFTPGTNAYSFVVSGSSTYFLWLDCSSTVTFNLAVGADTNSVIISQPNTQGNLQLDASICNTPVFFPTKPFFQVKYNGVYQTDPMTMSPLNVPGTLCLKTFFQNLTGDEGVRIFSFLFASGYASIQAPDSIPGNYNNGYWLKTVFGSNLITYKFIDALSTGRGDFDGSPNSCLAYEFCFTVTPLNNIPVSTEVSVIITTDGYGSAFNGSLVSGCCPALYPICHYNRGGSASGANAFGFGMNDPGGSLPVELISFYANVNQRNFVDLKWTTASETNNDYFTIERSNDATVWQEISRVKGAGNTTTYSDYSCVDEHPLIGISYYRLSQTDFDGTRKSFPPQAVSYDPDAEINIFPNPVNDKIYFNGKSDRKYEIEIYSSTGEKMIERKLSSSNQNEINVSTLVPGIYLLLVRDENYILKQEKIVVSR